MKDYKQLNKQNAGMRIWELISRSEMTVEEIAEFLCLSSPRVIYDWMRGTKTPTLERAYNLASLFNTTVEVIFFT